MNLFLKTLTKTKQKHSKRVGRGGKRGKTCGKGHKGQKSRSGNTYKNEGGQTPIYRRFPKRGFKRAKHKFDTLSLTTIQKFLSTTNQRTLTLKLIKSLILTKSTKPIKVLSGTFYEKINIQCDAISKSAKSKIETLMGSVYDNKQN